MFKLKQEDVKKIMDQRKSTRKTLLQHFKDQGELTTKDIHKIGAGGRARLTELRREGHVITTTREDAFNFRYTYLGERDEKGNMQEWVSD